MANFSERIRLLREQAGLTQEEVADVIQVNKQTISQYELGKRQPDFDKLERLCDYFNVSSDYLLGKSNITVRLLNTEELHILMQSKAGKDSSKKNEPPAAAGQLSDHPAENPDGDTKTYATVSMDDDSMAPLILKGDSVIYLKQETAESGDLIVFSLNEDNISVRKMILTESLITLQPFNPDYEPIILQGRKAIKNLRILGKVIESRHHF